MNYVFGAAGKKVRKRSPLCVTRTRRCNVDLSSRSKAKEEVDFQSPHKLTFIFSYVEPWAEVLSGAVDLSGFFWVVVECPLRQEQIFVLLGEVVVGPPPFGGGGRGAGGVGGLGICVPATTTLSGRRSQKKQAAASRFSRSSLDLSTSGLMPKMVYFLLRRL